MASTTFPIVGAYYRPPAKAILDHLPVGCPLLLCAEPDNPADPNAIAVEIRGDNIPETEELEIAVSGYGFSVPELRSNPTVKLGYIPREMAAVERARGFDGEVPAEFSVSANGAPRVRVDVTWG